MKRLTWAFLICMVLAMVFSAVAVAETGVGYNSGSIDGSGKITVTANNKPRYVYIIITGSKNVSTGAISVKKPGSNTYELLADFSGDTAKKVSISGSAGDYEFYIQCTGSCNVNITMTR